MRLSSPYRLSRFSLAATAAVYALGVSLAVLVTGYGAHRVATALAGEFAPRAKAPTHAATPSAPRAAAPSLAVRELKVVREAYMTPTQERWSRRSPGYYSYGPQFGSSSRGGFRQRGFFDGLFGWEMERPSETFRTVCVRLCDGYYFPVSFSAKRDRFERDRQVCENSCGTQGRLFVYRNPGGDLEDMRDLQGRSYRQLRTAFLYRTEYVADCKCKPHPWEEQATNRHRAYALAAAKRKGDKRAAAELEALEAKMREASRRPAKTAGLPGPVADYGSGPAVPAGSVTRVPSDAELMRLGRKKQEAKDPNPVRSNSDWQRRSFWRDF